MDAPLFLQPLRTSYFRKLCFGVGHVLNDLCASMWFSYLLVYFHFVAQFDNVMAGYVMLIGQISDGLCTPFIGYESDRTKGVCGYGKRKTWHLLGTACVLCSFPFIFNLCITCDHAASWAKLVYYAPFVVIFQFGWAATQISHLSLIPEITPLESERVELNSIRYSFTVLSNLVVYGLTWLLINVHDSDKIVSNISPADSVKFMELAFIVIGLGAIFSGIFHIGTKERTSISDLNVNRDASSSASYKPEPRRMKWSCWFKHPQFYLVAVLYTGTRLTVNMSQVYLPIFLTDSLNLAKSYIAIIPLVVYVSSFCTSIVMKIINKYVGRKGTYFLGTLFIFGACAWMWFIAENTAINKHIFGAAILLGAGCATILITSLSMTADLIAGNTESGAFVFGAMSLCDKLANGAGVMLVQQFHPCSGCCDKCAWYYQYIIVFVTSGASVMALVALLALLPQKIGCRDIALSVENSEAPNSTTGFIPTFRQRPLSPTTRYGSINGSSEIG